MITLTRLTGAPFAVNPDLIERIDHTPDTVITLVDGTKYLVRESLDAVVALVVEYRALILATAGRLERTAGETQRSHLAAVPPPPKSLGTAPDNAGPAGEPDGTLAAVSVVPLAPREQ